MDILLLNASFFKDGEYYKNELFVDNRNKKFSLSEERRGCGCGAMVVSENEREISREHAMDIFRAAEKSRNAKVWVNESGTLVIETDNCED